MTTKAINDVLSGRAQMIPLLVNHNWTQVIGRLEPGGIGEFSDGVNVTIEQLQRMFGTSGIQLLEMYEAPNANRVRDVRYVRRFQVLEFSLPGLGHADVGAACPIQSSTSTMSAALRELAVKIEIGEIVVTDCDTLNVLDERKDVTNRRFVTISYEIVAPEVQATKTCPQIEETLS